MNPKHEKMLKYKMARGKLILILYKKYFLITIEYIIFYNCPIEYY